MTESEDNKNELLATGGALGILSDFAKSDHDTLIGRQLGDYLVKERIGEGGMAVIYRAERADGSFDRDVAIKISPISGLNAAIRERFIREQAVLAGMNHPNISQLFDAQVTDEGWPYIVMELVDGLPIDLYCTENGLSLNERVALLVDVANAVAYAHSRLVVHRDIKPSNVLVDSGGRVRLLDFGIAKLIEDGARELTTDRPMTPRYASPEQLLDQPITIASDIYQLGILSAEVLTGQPPGVEESLTEAIQRAAAGKPSSLNTAQRQQLSSELAHIIDECLRVLPDERYTDANALQRDLRAWLGGYPVTAVGQGALYRFNKLLSRNKGATAVTTVLLAAIVVGTVSYTHSLNAARLEAENERDEAARQSLMADESLNFLTSILEYADPNKAQWGDTNIDDVLDAGADRVDTELAEQPEIQVRLYRTIAMVYDRQGRYDMVIPILEKAEEPTVAVHGESSPEYFALLNQRGNSLNRLGNFEEARAFFTTSLADAEHLLGSSHRETIKMRNNLGISMYSLGDLESFDAITAKNLSAAEDALDEGDSLRINVAHKRAIALVVTGELDAAKELARHYANVAEASLGPAHTNTVSHLSLLASAHGYSGELKEELEIQEMIVQRKREVLDENHPELAFSLNNLAVAYEQNEMYDQVEPVLEEVIDIRVATIGAEHPKTLHAKRNLAQFRATHLDLPDGMSDLYAVLEKQREIQGAEHHDAVETQLVYTTLMVGQGDPDATQAVAEAKALIERSIGPEHPVAAAFYSELTAAGFE